jgi:hypothetical protein
MPAAVLVAPVPVALVPPVPSVLVLPLLPQPASSAPKTSAEASAVRCD